MERTLEVHLRVSSLVYISLWTHPQVPASRLNKKYHMAGVRLTAQGVSPGQWRAGRSSLTEASPWPSSPLGLLLSSRYILGSRFIKNPAVPVAWPCLGKISALRVTRSQSKASLTRSRSLKQNCVLSFQETNGHIEFWSVSEEIFLFAPRFPEMDNVFISAGRVKKHKNCSTVLGSLESCWAKADMPPCILFYLKFSELNSGTEIYTRTHVASPGYCGIHIRVTVFIF